MKAAWREVSKNLLGGHRIKKVGTHYYRGMLDTKNFVAVFNFC